jgi:hypothetical protein
MSDSLPTNTGERSWSRPGVFDSSDREPSLDAPPASAKIFAIGIPSNWRRSLPSGRSSSMG